MNYLKTNPIGLDSVISEVQQVLYDKLTALWQAEMDGYPRCYVIKRKFKKTIEHYTNDGEYKSLFHAEGNKFFIVQDGAENQVANGYYTTKISIFFILNLKELKASIAHRADNEARVDVINVVDTITSISINTVEYGLDSIFAYLDWVVTDDLEPYHCFRIDCKVLDYSINQINGCN